MKTAEALAAAACRPLLATLSPGGTRARLSIFIFHRVLPAPDPMRPDEPDAERFAWQMALVASLFRVLPLSAAVRRLRAGTLPARAACITFDDGYSDNHAIALPILRRLGLTATFFVATGFLNGGRMFNDTVIEVLRQAPAGTLDLSAAGLGRHELHSLADRRTAVQAILQRMKYGSLEQRERWLDGMVTAVEAALPTDLMMSDEQVADLAAQGMEVGAHTVNHPMLTRESRTRVHEELTESREVLRELTGRDVAAFAYPNGRLGDDFVDAHRELVAELGFDTAVSTHPGVGTRRTDPFLLPRFTPWDRSVPRFAARSARNLQTTPFVRD